MNQFREEFQNQQFRVVTIGFLIFRENMLYAISILKDLM